MFTDVQTGDRVKVYVLGGADFTGTYQCPRYDESGIVRLVASNDKEILIRFEAVVAVVAL